MSDSQSSQHSLLVVQALIDSLVESTLLQFFFTGIYTLIFFQAIIPLVKHQKKAIVVILTALFITVVVNLAAVWQILRSVVVTHDATRNTMAQAIFTGPSHMQKMANGTLALSVIIADTFLVWRCYVLWQNNKWILISYSIVLLGELAVLPVYLALNITLGSHLGFLDLYFILSLCITITSTALIIYRIVDVSRQGNNEISRYHYSIKILVESGLLYTALILICGILHIVQDFGINNPGLIQATQDFDAILVPITGIAPTLIAARNAKGHVKKSDPEHSQAISRLSFRKDESSAEPMSFNDTESNTAISNKGWRVRTV